MLIAQLWILVYVGVQLFSDDNLGRFAFVCGEILLNVGHSLTAVYRVFTAGLSKSVSYLSTNLTS